LMTDDLSMAALSGTVAERSRAALAAGCDLVLHCNGQFDEMQAVAAEVPLLAGAAGARAAAAMAARRPAAGFDEPAARERFAALLAGDRSAVDGTVAS